MNPYGDSDQDYLAAVDSRVRRLRARVARNPNPWDPEYDADAAEQLAEIEQEKRIAQREFALGAMCLNEAMVLTRQHLGSTYHGMLDLVRYELAKKLVEDTHE